MTPGRARPTLPPAVIGLVIALCAVLLLKWLAVVALVGVGVVLLVGRRRPWTSGARRPAGPTVPTVTTAPLAPHPTPSDGGVRLAAPTVVASRPARVSRDDCSWCGLPGGHRTVDGALRRPRNVHAAR